METGVATQRPPGTSTGHADQTVAELVATCSDSVYRLAVSILRDHSLAEDVVQETIVKAWQSLESFRGEASLTTWVLRIGHNTAISMLRRRRDSVEDTDALVNASAEQLEDLVVSRIAVEALWKALAEVDGLSRSILVLRDVQGMSYEDIAHITGVTVPSVKTRLFRTRRAMAGQLKEWK